MSSRSSGHQFNFRVVFGVYGYCTKVILNREDDIRSAIGYDCLSVKNIYIFFGRQ